MESRKRDHIDLAFESQADPAYRDIRFDYEPLLNSHPTGEYEEFEFLSKKMRAPIWISSMTGGTELASRINANLARAAAEFGLGMGLGSCRVILDDEKHFSDFDQRDIIGDDLPFYANLGISQVEELLGRGESERIHGIIEKLRADGLIVHVNPMQEWLQPEGDLLKRPALESIKELLGLADYPVIVKEVGQGIGPESLMELLKLPLAAIEFAAYGGTNFASLELFRSSDVKKEMFRPFSLIGHTAEEMVEIINTFIENNNDIKCRQVIVSGGIKSFLDGYYLINKLKLPAVYGQASAFLKYARESYEELREFIKYQIKGLVLAKSFLRLRNSN